MEKEELINILNTKPDLDLFANEFMDAENLLPLLLTIVGTETSSIKYACTKVIRIISEKKPESIYPYFEEIVFWLHQPNSFIKWDAGRILANLAAVDREDKFSGIYGDYFAQIRDPQMITAANVIGAAWKIVLARPEWESDITGRLLEVPGITYLHEGEPSPECNDIACGHVIACFEQYFDKSKNQAAMIRFAEDQTNSSRKSVAKSAEKFLQRHRGI